MTRGGGRQTVFYFAELCAAFTWTYIAYTPLKFIPRIRQSIQFLSSAVTLKMLTRKDLRLNFYEISFYSKLNLIRLEVDPKSGAFTVVTTPWRRLLSGIQLVCFAVQTGNANYTLLQSLLFPEYFIPQHFIFHLTLASCSSLSLVWNAVYWNMWPRETTMLFNYSFPPPMQNVKPHRCCSTDSSSSSVIAVTLDSWESPCSSESKGQSDEQIEVGTQRGSALALLSQMMPIFAANVFISGLIVFIYEPSLRALRVSGKTDTSWSGYLMNFLKASYFMLYISSPGLLAEMQQLYLSKMLAKIRAIIAL